MNEKEQEEAKRKAEEEAKASSEPKGKSDNDKGDKYETTPIIERAREEREKLEAATKAQREENDRTEAIMTRRALGGTTEAGGIKEEKKEETPKEYANRITRNELKDGEG